jgi:hypothetical protein
MSKPVFQSDLVILTADKNMKFAIEGLLKRPKDLNIRPVTTAFFIHPERDPGCLLRANAILRPFTNHFAHAIVVFDREGCGKQEKTREDLENSVEIGLTQSGWKGRASVIVIDPELENWVFSDSLDVDKATGWAGKTPPLRHWLKSKGFLMEGQVKPTRPKEAMEAALRHVRRPRSSSIYAQLAERVRFSHCSDNAFQKFKKIIQSWFPVFEDKK